ncbi:hypothetical protein Lal_00002188 [Lupinus albus]|uniref:Putative transcription factor HSF-type-DNA-binding family n=1 Tax=Lupinus albus TaxID=3870 RepID=A0A6A4PQ23_LUPAL|nr:putative transcription factor HSF-type-DNA-binding family [Lupinus albus]KAF1893677.1 hypothetical protein Lal_00002188 [Lupinus albus]
MALLVDNNCEAILFPHHHHHKSVPAPFLAKTYQLVDDPTTDHIVSWGEDDTTFVVWCPSQFATDLLPNYFKHNNLSSFVRQLNTYGFRKIVPDRWEFANELFKKGEKHLLCDIRRRKTAQPQQVPMNHHHYDSSLGINGPFFFPFTSRVSISPPYDSDEQPNLCDSPPLTPVINGVAVNYNSSVTALSEDNERLRRRNNILTSELAHMKKLYNDIIYFVQNHVKPVAPTNTYSPFLLCNAPHQTVSSVSMMQRPMNQLLGYYSTTSTNPNQQLPYSTTQTQEQAHAVNSPTHTSRSSVTDVEWHSSNNCKTKLFGVSLQSKKRVHPEDGSNNPTNSETNKVRLVLEKDDLGLNLMPPSSSY